MKALFSGLLWVLFLSVSNCQGTYGQDTIPIFREIYDFEIGDKFAFQKFWSGPPNKWWKEILGKSYNDDSTVVTYEVLSSSYYMDYSYPYAEHSGSSISEWVFGDLNTSVDQFLNWCYAEPESDDTCFVNTELFCETTEYKCVMAFSSSEGPEWDVYIKKYARGLGRTYYTHQTGIGAHEEGLVGFDTHLYECNYSPPIVVGVNNYDEKRWNFYPNPASEFVRFDNEYRWFDEVSIFNQNGQLMMSSSLNCENACEIGFDLPDGIYSLVFRNQTLNRFYHTRLSVIND